MNNRSKNNNIGCFTAILGTVVVLLCTVIYAVISSLICNFTISTRFGQEIACALLPISFTVISISFVLYEIIFISYELTKVKKDAPDGASIKKAFRLLAPVCITISLIMSVVSANTYTKLGEDSIEKICFAKYESYSWNERSDVMRYTLACTPEGNLTYTLTMKDGEKIELFGSVNSCSDKFIEKYENLYGYAAYLCETFKDSEYIIEGKIIGEEYMESLYKESNPDIWKYLEQMINEGE